MDPHLKLISEFMKRSIESGNECVETMTASMTIAGKFLQFLSDNKIIGEGHAKLFSKAYEVDPKVFDAVLKALSVAIQVASDLERTRKENKEKVKNKETRSSAVQNGFSKVIGKDAPDKITKNKDKKNIESLRPPLKDSLLWTIFIPGTPINHAIKLEMN